MQPGSTLSTNAILSSPILAHLERIESRGRLVAENNRWGAEELTSNGQAFPLPSRYSPCFVIAHDRIGHLKRHVKRTKRNMTVENTIEWVFPASIYTSLSVDWASNGCTVANPLLYDYPLRFSLRPSFAIGLVTSLSGHPSIALPMAFTTQNPPTEGSSSQFRSINRRAFY